MDNPKIWALLVETTQYWDPKVIKHTGRVFDAYVYDSAEQPHSSCYSDSLSAWHGSREGGSEWISP